MKFLAAVLAFWPALVGAEPVRDLNVSLIGVVEFDRSRLIGDWYEVAQTPNMLELDCFGTTVAVALREDSRLTLKIACRIGALDGPVLPIEGIMAEVQPSWFAVRFVRLAELGVQDLIVLWMAEDGSLVVLGAPLGQLGWVWSKTAQPDEAALAAAEAVLVANGYRQKAIARVKQAD